jgi:PAS domain S-box-containing protein
MRAKDKADAQMVRVTSPPLISLKLTDSKDYLRILHVDDDICFLEISKQILEMENKFEIDNVTSVDEAFQKLGAKSYDAVISDYEMPPKNGLDFLKELREQQRDIPFILFTGKGREEVVVDALNLGADRYINKNGSPETVYCELADAINKTVERKKSSELLARSESKYHSLVENSLQGIAILQTTPFRIVFANGALGEILGYSSQELTSLSPQEIMSLVYHEDRAVFFKRMENRLRGEPAEACFEFRAVRKDCSIIWLSSLANRVDFDGQPAVQGMFLDVNESKKAAEILRESEERYRELANCLPSIVFETDLKGQLEFANERASEISGYSLEEIERGVNIFQFISPEDRDRATKSIQRLLSGGSYVPSEYKFMRKDGTTFPALITATPRVYKNKVTGFRGMVLDISERKKADLELKQYNEVLEKVSEGIDAGLAVIDRDYRVVWANKQLMDLGVVPNKKCYETFTNLGIVCPDCGVERVFLNNAPIDIHEYKTVNSKGETIWVELRVTPLKDPNGVTIAALELAVPITERKKAEQFLMESEEKFRKAFETSPDACYIGTMEDGTIIEVNNSFSGVWGYTREECVGKTSIQLGLYAKGEPDRQRMLAELKLKGNFSNLEFDGKRKNGEVFPLLFSGSTLEIKGKRFIYGVLRDITERKKAEEKLQLDEERLKLAQRISQVGIWDFDVSSGELFWDEVICRISGVSFELRPSLENFFKIVHPDDLEFVKKTIQGALEGKPFDIEMRILRPDVTERVVKSMGELKGNSQGKPNRLFGIVQDITERKKAEEAIKFQADLLNHVGQAIIMVDNNRIIRFWNKAAEKLYGWQEEQALGHQITELLGIVSPKESDEILSKLMAGESWSTESLIKNKDGSVVPVILNRTPIFKEKGEFSGSAIITTDITLQKRTEADLTFSLESLSSSLAKIQELNEKLRVVGDLTRHDVRNKLSAVTGYAYILKKKHADEADVVEGLGKMEMAVKYALKIFDFAKMYEQIGSEELTYVNVEEKLKDASALFSGPVPTIINECHGLIVLADSFLRQLFYNFIDNTRKYGKKTTTIRVYFEKTDLDSLKLIYEDDGVGVPLENKSSLFKEGFSTGGSTGFGLFLTKKMVDVYGWKIEENGEPGKGAKFTITIPKLNKNGKESFQIS